MVTCCAVRVAAVAGGMDIPDLTHHVRVDMMPPMRNSRRIFSSSVFSGVDMVAMIWVWNLWRIWG